jgi:hypothetical protein
MLRCYLDDADEGTIQKKPRPTETAPGARINSDVQMNLTIELYERRLAKCPAARGCTATTASFRSDMAWLCTGAVNFETATCLMT